MVSVVDLGLGNLHSVVGAIERVGGVAHIVDDVAGVESAPRLVVPGQGGFRDGARATSGAMGDAIRAVIDSGRPYLGICLGMQLLFEGSDEAPGAAGLGVLSGRCKRFDAAPERKVPHMGWNDIVSSHPMLESDAYYYFVHSYYCVPDDESLVAATADYGGAFCAAVARDNILAVQFHPEKSQLRGETLLKTFLQASS